MQVIALLLLARQPESKVEYLTVAQINEDRKPSPTQNFKILARRYHPLFIPGNIVASKWR